MGLLRYHVGAIRPGESAPDCLPRPRCVPGIPIEEFFLTGIEPHSFCYFIDMFPVMAFPAQEDQVGGFGVPTKAHRNLVVDFQIRRATAHRTMPPGAFGDQDRDEPPCTASRAYSRPDQFIPPLRDPPVPVAPRFPEAGVMRVHTCGAPAPGGYIFVHIHGLVLMAETGS
jgi:hypothetical protein